MRDSQYWWEYIYSVWLELIVNIRNTENWYPKEHFFSFSPSFIWKKCIDDKQKDGSTVFFYLSMSPRKHRKWALAFAIVYIALSKSSMTGKIAELTASFSIDPCARLFMSSDVQPKWKNSSTCNEFINIPIRNLTYR